MEMSSVKWRLSEKQRCGSEAFQTPGSGFKIRDRKKSVSRMKISYHISESLYLNSLLRLWIRDLLGPGSGIPDGKILIRDTHPGSATLLKRVRTHKLLFIRGEGGRGWKELLNQY
jgi:hypothetical protein